MAKAKKTPGNGAKGAARTASPEGESSATLGFETTLWQAADKLRNNMDAAEYKTRPVLDLAQERALENIQLARVRDALLPRLLSGELPIRRAERFVEDPL